MTTARTFYILALPPKAGQADYVSLEHAMRHETLEQAIEAGTSAGTHTPAYRVFRVDLAEVARITPWIEYTIDRAQDQP